MKNRASSWWFSWPCCGADRGFFTLHAYAQDPDNDASSSGCSPQSIVLPLEIQLHWGLPDYSFWAFIDIVGVTDDPAVCFAGAGTVTASIG